MKYDLREKSEALIASRDMWGELALTGHYKHNTAVYNDNPSMISDCPLCQYVELKDSDSGCQLCPYLKMFGHCNTSNSIFYKWNNCGSVNNRKKYAAQFVGQIDLIVEDHKNSLDKAIENLPRKRSKKEILESDEWETIDDLDLSIGGKSYTKCSVGIANNLSVVIELFAVEHDTEESVRKEIREDFIPQY